MKTPKGEDYRKCLTDPESQAIAGVVTPIQGKRTDKYFRICNDDEEANDHACELHRTKTIRAAFLPKNK